MGRRDTSDQRLDEMIAAWRQEGGNLVPDDARARRDEILEKMAETGVADDLHVFFKDELLVQTLMLSSKRAWNWPIEDVRRAYSDWLLHLGDRRPPTYFATAITYARILAEHREIAEAKEVLSALRRELERLPTELTDDQGISVQQKLGRIDEVIMDLEQSSRRPE